MGEVARGKALAVVVEAAKVTDTNGVLVDLSDEDEDDEAAAGTETVEAAADDKGDDKGDKTEA